MVPSIFHEEAQRSWLHFQDNLELRGILVPEVCPSLLNLNDLTVKVSMNLGFNCPALFAFGSFPMCAAKRVPFRCQ